MAGHVPLLEVTYVAPEMAAFKCRTSSLLHPSEIFAQLGFQVQLDSYAITVAILNNYE